MSQSEGSQRSFRPAIILVQPQLGENVGAAARAMLNCGLDDLRLVSPRDGWPNPQAVASATGAAASVLERARLFESTGEAVADLQWIYATTARHRDMLKELATPEEAALQLYRAAAMGERGGFLFGPERTGLHNDDVALADRVLRIPLNPEFPSLNLGQAVLLVAHACFRCAGDEPAPIPLSQQSVSRRATSGELQNLFEHLEQELDASGFLRLREKRAIVVRNLRNLLHRATLQRHEVKTLHGIVSALSGRRKDGRPVRAGARREADGERDSEP